MKLDRPSIALLYRLEMQSILRDRRTVLLSIVLPLLIMPIMMFTSSKIEKQRQRSIREKPRAFAVTGDRADFARKLLADAIARPPKTPPPEDVPPLQLEEVRHDDPAKALAEGAIDFYVAGWSPETAKVESVPVETIPGGDVADSRDDVPVVAVFFRGNNATSSLVSRQVRELLSRERDERRSDLLVERGFPVDPRQVASIQPVNVASSGQVMGSRVGRFLTAIITLFLLTGAASAATDSLAGEKERGTLETLLTTSANRLDIVAAKLLGVFTVSLLTTVIQIGNLAVYVGLGLVDLPKNFDVDLSPLTLLLVFVLYVPVIVLLSSTLLLFSGYAKTFKEAQMSFMPTLLVALVLSLASMLPAITLRSAIALVPLANISVAIREILSGQFDWPMLALSWLVTAAFTVFMVRLTVNSLSAEKLITSAEADEGDLQGGPAIFPKRVLRWFSIMWTLLVLAAVSGSLKDVRSAVTFNLVGVFLTGSLLMIWRYRLDVREALALRPVRPIVWLAVLLGVPSAIFAGNGLFRIVNIFLPVPERLIEQFTKVLLPPDIPLWQLVFFIAVLPAICEEIAFRGLLLYGLRRRFRPLAVCLVVGAIFGIFHIDLFRIIPTAFLGFMLTAVTLLTGSIFPAMAWHFLNNATSILLSRQEGAGAEPPLWIFFPSMAALALVFWILWRNRTPYPGLREEI